MLTVLNVYEANNYYLNLLYEYKSIYNYRDLLVFINNFCFTANYILMYHLVYLACVRTIINKVSLAELVLPHNITNPDIKANIEKWQKHISSLENIDIDKYNFNLINFINICLFVVQDINLFINNVKNKGYPINNQGVQYNKSEISEITSFLAKIEIKYLNSVYNKQNII